MMNSHETRLHPVECKCFTWSPIIVGALTAVGLTFLLNLFSVAIGLTAYTTTSDGVENLALGGLMATAFGVIVSMFAAGWLAGYLGNRHCTKRHLGALYGFLAWCVALIATIFLADHIQHYIALYNHFISGMPVKEIAVTATNTTTSHVANAQISTNNIVISSYIIFCLYFLSAFAASLGGHCGMCYINCDERVR